MTADRWVKIKALFHAALERAPEDRAAFLTDACAGDADAAALRAEVDRLLNAHAEAGSFIESSAVPAAVGSGAATRPAMSGRRIGRYEVGRLVGAGGMGEVYLARDVELGRDVALKIGIGSDADAHARLKREAQHASQLNHPHICTIYEVGASDGQFFIVMEYVEGQRLSDHIPASGLPTETMLRYGIQIADALAHAHRNGVTHRDLKSANVVVTPEGRAKVLDFGLARRLSAERLKDLSASRDSVTAQGQVSGTLSYMAPELLRGAQADAASDIWALGVMLYEMAAGVRPFSGATGFELSAAILYEPPAPLPDRIPVSLQAIIRRCLAKDLHERYRHAGEVRSALEAVQSQVVGGAAQTPRAVVTTRVVRSKVAVAALASVVVIAFAGTAIWRRATPAAAPVALGASGRPAIAVMSFANLGGGQETAWLSQGVPSMLLTGLAQTRGLDIVSAERLHEVIRQTGQESLESLDRGQVSEVAKRAGAGAIVVGSIVTSGSEIRIDARLEDLSSGRVLAAETARGTDLFALVDQISARIRDGVGFRDATGIRRVAEISSSSLEAQRLYAIGMAASTNLRLEEARQALEAAVAIDPSFADAYSRLGFIYASTGRTAARKAAFAKVLEHADRLSERARLRVRMVAAFEAGTFAEAAPLLDELLAKFPDTDIAYTLAKVLYAPVTGPLDNPQKLFAIVQQGTLALPSSTYIRNEYGYALLARGRYADAIREFEAYARMAPREPNPYDSLGEASLLMGHPEKAIENYSRALIIDPAFIGSHNGRAWSLATLGRFDEALAENPPAPHIKALILSRVGRYREAGEAIAAGIRDADSNENPESAAVLSLLAATLAIERKESARALEHTASAVRSIAAIPLARRRGFLVAVDLMAGAAELQRGKITAARSHLESQKRAYKPGSVAEHWWYRALEGEIALAGHDQDNAEAAFSGGAPSTRFFSFYTGLSAVLANDVLFRDGLARVTVARGDLTGAIQIYRRLLTYGPAQNWAAAFEPRYVLEIARLLERAGDKAAARQEYEQFLNLWKGADPDLPELAEARQALARR